MKFCLLMMVLFFPLAGHSAESSNNEYAEIYWQPNQGQHAATASLSYMHYKAETTISGSNYKVDTTGNGTHFSAGYEYGLTENFALGVDWGYSSTTFSSSLTYGGAELSKSNSKYSGLTNIGFDFSGRHILQSAAIYYGLYVSASPGASTYDEAADKGDSYSGSTNVTPNAAFSTKAAPNVLLGVGGSYTIQGPRKSKRTNPTSEITTTGGNVIAISVFSEFPMGQWTPGFALHYSKSEKTKSTSSSSTNEYSGSGNFGASVSSVFRPSGNIDILTAAMYGRPSETESNGMVVDNAYSLGVSAGVRFLF